MIVVRRCSFGHGGIARRRAVTIGVGRRRRRPSDRPSRSFRRAGSCRLPPPDRRDATDRPCVSPGRRVHARPCASTRGARWRSVLWASLCNRSMNRRVVLDRSLPRRWMIPSGRTNSSVARGTATSVPPATSAATAGWGRMETPAPISTARFIVSTLSNSITTRTSTSCNCSTRSSSRRIVRSESKPMKFSSCNDSSSTTLASGQRMIGRADQHHRFFAPGGSPRPTATPGDS